MVTPTPKPAEEITALDKRVTELEKGLKESLKREVTLARKVVALEKKLSGLETAHAMLRSNVSQVASAKLRG